MAHAFHLTDKRLSGREWPGQIGARSNSMLAAEITRLASKQTYYTIRFLVDRPLVADAYRAYAYFRWLDDSLDRGQMERNERLAFVGRQQELVKRCYRGEAQPDLTAEEGMLVELIGRDNACGSGLELYIRYMMAVMAFDAGRRGRLISQIELDQYTRWLATAVTEALHYFIGHNDASPACRTRYLAVTGAHITHMLRDTVEDLAAGYINVPGECLWAQGIELSTLESDAFRTWVRSRVQLARDCFAAGRLYLARVENLRCRLAGYAYIARFEGVLTALERADFLISPTLARSSRLREGLRGGWSLLTSALWPQSRHCLGGTKGAAR